jgi:hypothetical protein
VEFGTGHPIFRMNISTHVQQRRVRDDQKADGVNLAGFSFDLLFNPLSGGYMIPETSVNINGTTLHCNPKDHILLYPVYKVLFRAVSKRVLPVT